MNVKSDNRLKSETDEIINLYKRKNFNQALILSNNLIEKEKNIPFFKFHFQCNVIINIVIH